MLGAGSVVLVTEPEGMDELRERLRRAEDDARAARYLAGGADRDTAELRAEVRGFRDQNNRVLTAMREDLTDLRKHVDRGFAQADRNFLAVNTKIDGVAAGLQTITDLLVRREQDDDPSEPWTSGVTLG
jgi:hypothetical protein